MARNYKKVKSIFGDILIPINKDFCSLCKSIHPLFSRCSNIDFTHLTFNKTQKTFLRNIREHRKIGRVDRVISKL